MELDLSEALQRLTPEERQQLINGISPEAALVLKKILPNNQLIDTLIRLKTGFSNF